MAGPVGDAADRPGPPPPLSGPPGSAAVAWQERFPPIGYWVRVGVVIIVVLLALKLMAVLQGILLVLAASTVLAIGLQPAIGWFERRGTPRPVALAIILVAGLLGAVGVAMAIVPVVVEQVRALAEQVPAWLEGVERDGGFLGTLADRLEDGSLVTTAEVPDGAVSALGGVVATAFDLLLVLTLTPYFAFGMPSIKRWGVRLLVRDDREEFLRLLNRSTDLMANYIAGNLLVSVIAGVTAYVGLLAIGVPYAAALAVFVAIMDLIPAVGATIGAAAVVAVAATQGVPQLVAAAVLTIGYQQVENFVIVPRVMRRAIDVGPATGIVALLVGGTLAGPVGALLALPVTAMLQIVLEEFVLRERIAAVRAADAAAQAAAQAGGPVARRRRRGPAQLP